MLQRLANRSSTILSPITFMSEPRAFVGGHAVLEQGA